MSLDNFIRSTIKLTSFLVGIATVLVLVWNALAPDKWCWLSPKTVSVFGFLAVIGFFLAIGGWAMRIFDDDY